MKNEDELTPAVGSLKRLIGRPDDYPGMRVAEFLNSSDQEGKRRIVKLLKLLRDLENLSRAELQEVTVARDDKGDAALEILTPHQTIQEIGYLLSRYTLHPSIEVRTGVNEIAFTKVAAEPESDAANALTEIFKAKKLHLIGTCTSCREWFYARKENQEFCQRKCRIDHRRETPRGRAIHQAEGKLAYWKKQKEFWGGRVSSLELSIKSAPRSARRDIEGQLGTAKERYENALMGMKETSKALGAAQKMPTVN